MAARARSRPPSRLTAFCAATRSSTEIFVALIRTVFALPAVVATGLPETPLSIKAFSLTMQRRRLAGTNNGGIPQTQQMLDFCGEHAIGSDIELIGAQDINRAWERVVASDVRYRFVIDTATLGA